MRPPRATRTSTKARPRSTSSTRTATSTPSDTEDDFTRGRSDPAPLSICNAILFSRVIRKGCGMETVESRAEQRVLLHNISWETYERLLDERGDSRVPRLAYDRGELEIMSPS